MVHKARRCTPVRVNDTAALVLIYKDALPLKLAALQVFNVNFSSRVRIEQPINEQISSTGIDHNATSRKA